MITVYKLDSQNVFTKALSVDPMAPLPRPCVIAAPPPTAGDEVAQWNGAAWAVLPGRPAAPAGPTDAQRRKDMPPITPLQGILTLGETDWGKVLTYRDTASWAEKIVIDNAADWVRTSQNIAFFGHLLNYTEAKMDQLFTDAALVIA